jgi:MGT family glycosyltransferase
MRVLQVIWDGGGNAPPQLAIARELVERGHEVTVLAHRVQRPKVEATGARFAAYRHAPEGDASRPETDLLRDWEARTPLGAFARLRDRVMFGPAAAFARDVAESLGDAPADVVAWDYLLPGAAVAAEAAGTPSAAVVHTVYPLPAAGAPPFGPGLKPMHGPAGRARDAVVARALARLFAPGLAPLNRARAEHGLPPLQDAYDGLRRADRLLVMTAPELDLARDLPDNVRYAGPLRAPVSRAWESPWPDDDPRPLVLISFSTTFMGQSALAQRALDAVAALPVRALLTTGPAIDGSRLRRPPNAEIRDFVPHADVLPHAALMVTHAGLGTVHAALTAGVPLVCVPGGRDQPDTAARVVHHRAGVRAGARGLRRAIERALADSELELGARRMAEAFARHDGAARAANELEALTAG